MSNYTTQLRNICEMYTSKKREGFDNIVEIISQSAPKIFDFDYPIFDRSYKHALECKIITHFYTREICEETVGLWKLRLKAKMNEIMPYYNQLYESTLFKYNPFYDVDYITDHKGRANERKMQDRTVDKYNNTDFTEGVTSGYRLNGYENIDDTTAQTSDTRANENEFNNTQSYDSKNAIENTTSDVNKNSKVSANITQVSDKLSTNLTDINGNESIFSTTEGKKHSTDDKTDNINTNIEKSSKAVENEVNDETNLRLPNTVETTDGYSNVDDTGTSATNRNLQKSTYEEMADNSNVTEFIEGTLDKTAESLDLYSDTPQGNLLYVDNGNGTIGGYNEATGETQSLQTKLQIGWLTNGRQINTAENEKTTSGRNTEGDEIKATQFDETTDEDTTFTKKFNTQTDNLSHKTMSGEDYSEKNVTGNVQKDVVEKNDEVSDKSEYAVMESEESGISNSDKDTSNVEKSNGSENTLTDENKESFENTNETTDSIKDSTEKSDNQSVSDTENYSDEHNKTNIDYSRLKSNENVYASDKSVDNNRQFLENVKDDLRHTIRNTDEYINHTVGKISSMTYSKMLLEFRQTFLNIDQMIIDELEILFFGLF